MPVIVIGADTLYGRAAIEALLPGVGELRAFISDPAELDELKRRGIKVAIGDVSDGSHVGGAAMRAFCAVAVPDAAFDDRERSFADTPEAVMAAWADGLRDAGIQRVIWLEDPRLSDMAAVFARCAPETAAVPTADLTPEEIGTAVAELEAAPTLSPTEPG
jgi:hypothetical protein